MVPIGTLETVARIVDYQRFYKPRIKEFIDGFEYEYVQFSFKDILFWLPDLDVTGDRKPTCTTFQSWRKGVWGSAFGVLNKNLIKDYMKKDKIRARKMLKTSYLKTLLETKPLSFSWRNMHIVVFPKKVIKHGDKEILDQHKVYVNGVEQRLLEAKPDSKLHKTWFAKITDRTYQRDWRYLLSLDWPEQPGTDILYKYFEGVYTGDESKFENIGKNYSDGKVDRAEEIYHKKPETKTQRKQVANKLRGKVPILEYPEKDPTMGVTRVHTPKHHTDVSLVVALERARKLAHKRKAKREASIIAAKLLKNDKLYWSEKREEQNREYMKGQETVCIESQLTKRVFKVTKWFEYVPKIMWKVQQRLEREERKAIAEKNAKPFSGANRKQRRQWKQKKKPGSFAKYLTIGPVYETQDHPDGLIWRDKDGYALYDSENNVIPVQVPVMEEITRKTVRPLYEGRPVLYGTSNPKAGEPFQIPQIQEDGSLKVGQVYKKVLNVLDELTYTYLVPKIKYSKRTILQHNFKGKEHDIKSKEQVEESKPVDTGDNEGQEQEDSSVEKVRRTNKRKHSIEEGDRRESQGKRTRVPSTSKERVTA
jgi:hypothetical protein